MQKQDISSDNLRRKTALTGCKNMVHGSKLETVCIKALPIRWCAWRSCGASKVGCFGRFVSLAAEKHVFERQVAVAVLSGAGRLPRIRELVHMPKVSRMAGEVVPGRGSNLRPSFNLLFVWLTAAFV